MLVLLMKVLIDFFGMGRELGLVHYIVRGGLASIKGQVCICSLSV